MLGLTSGYVTRAIDRLPKQGARTPWRVHQNYLKDRRLMRRRPINDEGVRFDRAKRDEFPAEHPPTLATLHQG